MLGSDSWLSPQKSSLVKGSWQHWRRWALVPVSVASVQVFRSPVCPEVIQVMFSSDNGKSFWEFLNKLTTTLEWLAFPNSPLLHHVIAARVAYLVRKIASLTPTAVEMNWKLPDGYHSRGVSIALALFGVNMEFTVRDQCLSSQLQYSGCSTGSYNWSWGRFSIYCAKLWSCVANYWWT